MAFDFWKRQISQLHWPRRQRRGVALVTLMLSLIVAAYIITAAVFAERVAYRDRSAQVTAREISDIANRLSTYMVANVMYTASPPAHERVDVHSVAWRSNIDPEYTYECETGSVGGGDCADSSIAIYPRVEIALHAFNDSRFATPVGVVVVNFKDSDVDEVFRELVRRYVENNASNKTVQGVNAAKVYEDNITGSTLDDGDGGAEFAFFAHSFARHGADYVIRKAYPVARSNTIEVLKVGTSSSPANLNIERSGAVGGNVNANTPNITSSITVTDTIDATIFKVENTTSAAATLDLDVNSTLIVNGRLTDDDTTTSSLDGNFDGNFTVNSLSSSGSINVTGADAGTSTEDFSIKLDGTSSQIFIDGDLTASGDINPDGHQQREAATDSLLLVDELVSTGTTSGSGVEITNTLEGNLLKVKNSDAAVFGELIVNKDTTVTPNTGGDVLVTGSTLIDIVTPTTSDVLEVDGDWLIEQEPKTADDGTPLPTTDLFLTVLGGFEATVAPSTP